MYLQCVVQVPSIVHTDLRYLVIILLGWIYPDMGKPQRGSEEVQPASTSCILKDLVDPDSRHLTPLELLPWKWNLALFTATIPVVDGYLQWPVPAPVVSFLSLSGCGNKTTKGNMAHYTSTSHMLEQIIYPVMIPFIIVIKYEFTPYPENPHYKNSGSGTCPKMAVVHPSGTCIYHNGTLP